MEEDRLWFLIARHLSKEITAEESTELQKMLKLHPHKQYFVDILHSYFNLPDHSKEMDQVTDSLYEEKFHKIINRVEFNKVPLLDQTKATKAFAFTRIWPIAAAVMGIILVSGLGYYFFRQRKAPEENLTARVNEVISKSGARTKLTLPDRTEVWLNSGSRLIYSNDYNKISREVELEGEGFFDVVKDAKHPFIVHVSSLNIKVVGTAFNVKSYPQDETVETTLLRGIIEVSRKDNPNAPKVILKPNEKLIFNKQLANEEQQNAGNKQRSQTSVRDISVTAVPKNIPDSNKVETSWVYNRLVFEGDSFQELAEKMERWYNVKISFSSKELLHYRFKGAFANETITEALNALQLTADFRYQIDNNEIMLFKK